MQYRNKDLVRYFGGTCPITDAQDHRRDLVRQQLRNVHRIDRNLCTWTRDTRGQFENVMQIATPLEKTALGFGYQQIFGAASSQMHLNMCIFYDPKVKGREFLKRVDNLALLVVSTVLRLVRIVELANNGALAPSSAALKTEFNGAIPNSYVAAALGVADQNDIVVVFEPPDFFLAQVDEKKGGNGTITEAKAKAAVRTELAAVEATTAADQAPSPATNAAATAALTAATVAANDAAEYVSYTVRPINNIGRTGSFTDAETMVIARSNEIGALLQEAVNAGIINQDTVDRGEIFALMKVVNSPQGLNEIIMPRSNAANMPVLYFVHRYLRRMADENQPVVVNA